MKTNVGLVSTGADSTACCPEFLMSCQAGLFIFFSRIFTTCVRKIKYAFNWVVQMFFFRCRLLVRLVPVEIQLATPCQEFSLTDWEGFISKFYRCFGLL